MQLTTCRRGHWQIKLLMLGHFPLPSSSPLTSCSLPVLYPSPTSLLPLLSPLLFLRPLLSLPSPSLLVQLGVWGERCKLLRRVQGGVPARNSFFYHLTRENASDDNRFSNLHLYISIMHTVNWPESRSHEKFFNVCVASPIGKGPWRCTISAVW